MKLCNWVDITPRDHRGFRRVRCVNCGRELSSPYEYDKIVFLCGPVPMQDDADRPNSILSAPELAELFPDDSDPKLLGNKIQQLIKSFGIPPCVGCDERRKWINKAHKWLRQTFGQQLPPPT